MSFVCALQNVDIESSLLKYCLTIHLLCATAEKIELSHCICHTRNNQLGKNCYKYPSSFHYSQLTYHIYVVYIDLNANLCAIFS